MPASIIMPASICVSQYTCLHMPASICVSQYACLNMPASICVPQYASASICVPQYACLNMRASVCPTLFSHPFPQQAYAFNDNKVRCRRSVCRRGYRVADCREIPILLDIQDCTHAFRTSIQASRAKYPSIQYQVASNIYIIASGWCRR